MENVSFKANIKINHSKIKEGLMSDLYFNNSNKKDLKNTLKQIEELSKMKEKSTVEINSRLDNNQLNLICTVQDKTNTIKTTIFERSGRKISTDENFAKRFVSNIARAITNVDITRKSLKQINKTIKDSETIKDDKFISNLPSHIIESLNKGNNPTKRIVSVLKKIDKEYPNEKNIISINHKQSINKNGNSYTTTFFVVKNTRGERKIPITFLLKDPTQNLFA